ncbi:oxidoreductase [Ascochyta rabiei]|uniref:Oxidoreductase n=1 Tax=Didymella rabiei TaxID=5454 RepID=A0A163IBJ9_DIDRA|nr:oxidoreductase [Ascochyta rabiei]
MAPFRVAHAGLSASAKVTWAADAHLPYLLSTKGKKHYEVVALLNSFVEAAKSTKATFDLPADVKTYGDPSKLAADPNIDLVVVNTRADVHFPVAEPSVRAGKGLFIEWPLTEDLTKAFELTRVQLYHSSVVGLQGRVVPLTLRLKEILATGIIGKVLNSEVHACGKLTPRDSLPESLAYFADRRGDEIFPTLLDRYSGPRRISLARTGKLPETWDPTHQILLSVHGSLEDETVITVPGATLVATFRLGLQVKGKPDIAWTINGEKGELRMNAPGPFLQARNSFDGPIEIAHHDHATDKVTELDWDWPEWQKNLGLRARSCAELYGKFAEWIEDGRPEIVPEGMQWPRLEDGVALMIEFDILYRQISPYW